MKKKLIYKLWLTAFIIMLVGCTEEKRNVIKRETGIIEFSIAGTKFEIPSEYFKGAYETKSGEQSGANLWALWPDFEGYNESNKNAFLDYHGLGRKVRINLQRREHHLYAKDYLDKSHNFSGPYASLKKDNYDYQIYDLDVYQDAFLSFDLYIYKSTNVVKLVMTCNSEGSVPYPGCDVWWDYNENIIAKFSFDQKYLKDWHLIWNKVNSLLRNEYL